MMTRQQAREMFAAFTAIGGFSSIDVHFCGGFRSDEYTAEDNAAQLWVVELWCRNSRAGNNNLEVIKTYTAKSSEIKMLARKAKGKATENDRAAFARFSAEKSLNAE